MRKCKTTLPPLLRICQLYFASTRRRSVLGCIPTLEHGNDKTISKTANLAVWNVINPQPLKNPEKRYNPVMDISLVTVNLNTAMTWAGGAFVAGMAAGFALAQYLTNRSNDPVDQFTKTCNILAKHPDHDGTVVTFTRRGKLINLRCWAMRGNRYCPLLKAKCQLFKR